MVKNDAVQIGAEGHKTRNSQFQSLAPYLLFPPSNRCHRIVLAACSSYLKTLIETSPPGDDVTLLLDDTSNHQMEHLISFIYSGTASLARHSDYRSLVTALRTLGVKANPGEEKEQTDAAKEEGEEGGEEERDLVAPTWTPPSRTKPPSSCASPPTRELASEEPSAFGADATASAAGEEDLMLLCSGEGVRGGNGAADDDLSLRNLLLRLHQQQQQPQQPVTATGAQDHARRQREQHSHHAHKNADVNAAVDEHEHEEEEENGHSNLLLSSSLWPSCNESWCPPPPPPRRTDLFAEEEREEQSQPPPLCPRRRRGDHEGNEDAEHVQSSFSTVDKSAILYCNIAAADDDATISVSPHAAADGDNGSLMQSEGQTLQSSSSSPSSFSSPSPSSIGSSGADENLPPASQLDLIFNGHLEHHGNAAHVDAGRPNRPEACIDARPVEGQLLGEKDRKRRRQRRRSSDESTHRCGQCRKRFASQHYLRFHENSVHSKTKTVSCDECSKKFTSVYYLKQHTVRVHSETKPFPW